MLQGRCSCWRERPQRVDQIARHGVAGKCGVALGRVTTIQPESWIVVSLHPVFGAARLSRIRYLTAVSYSIASAGTRCLSVALSSSRLSCAFKADHGCDRCRLWSRNRDRLRSSWLRMNFACDIEDRCVIVKAEATFSQVE